MNGFNFEEPFIFLAEDDIDDQELLIEAFSGIDPRIKIQAVNNGKKAVSFLDALEAGISPCLIVLDYNLPELSGAEILEQLNQMPKFDNVAKIVWSTSNSPIYERICLALGAKAYVVKPNDLEGVKKLARFMMEHCSLKKD